jgi:hypothetical protein
VRKKKSLNPSEVVRVSPPTTAHKGGGGAGARDLKARRTTTFDTDATAGPKGLPPVSNETIELYYRHAINRAICTKLHITPADPKNPPLTCPEQNKGAAGEALGVCGAPIVKVREYDPIARGGLIECLRPVVDAVLKKHFLGLKGNELIIAKGAGHRALFESLEVVDPSKAPDAGSLVRWLFSRIRDRIGRAMQSRAGQGLGLSLQGEGALAGVGDEKSGELASRDIKAISRARGIVSFESEEVDYADILGGDDGLAEAEARLAVDLEALYEALVKLEPTDQELVIRTWGVFEDKWGYRAAGARLMAKELGVSTQTIYERQKQIFQKLRPVIAEARREKGL